MSMCEGEFEYMLIWCLLWLYMLFMRNELLRWEIISLYGYNLLIVVKLNGVPFWIIGWFMVILDDSIMWSFGLECFGEMW